MLLRSSSGANARLVAAVPRSDFVTSASQARPRIDAGTPDRLAQHAGESCNMSGAQRTAGGLNVHSTITVKPSLLSCLSSWSPGSAKLAVVSRNTSKPILRPRLKAKTRYRLISR